MRQANYSETVFDDYVKTCYPQGCPELQRKELYMAFIAGSIVTMDHLKEITREGEVEEAAKVAQEYYEEVESIAESFTKKDEST